MNARSFSMSILVLLIAACVIGFQEAREVERLVDALDVDPGEVFADVGAGDGRFSLALAARVGNDGRVYATEVDRDDLKEIRGRVAEDQTSNVTVIEGSQSSTGLPDICCDGILLRRVYHHFQDPDAMRESLKRALKEDGLLLIIDFGEKRHWSRPAGIPESRDGHGIAKEMLVSEMELAGFELVRDLDWPNDDYALLFRVARVPD
ncbi:MAG TPA: methyltransferase domain-containing protein [Vicinamibacteria bacterium]|nr:methyltransferase domain-containing protein [Vicinamibacteria bacterium]